MARQALVVRRAGFFNAQSFNARFTIVTCALTTRPAPAHALGCQGHASAAPVHHVARDLGEEKEEEVSVWRSSSRGREAGENADTSTSRAAFRKQQRKKQQGSMVRGGMECLRRLRSRVGAEQQPLQLSGRGVSLGQQGAPAATPQDGRGKSSTFERSWQRRPIDVLSGSTARQYRSLALMGQARGAGFDS
jgi:hypothetical protein